MLLLFRHWVTAISISFVLIGYLTPIYWRKNRCSMTYMRPAFDVEIPRVDGARYSLKRYTGDSNTKSRRQFAALFVPGHKGNAEQSRSLASHLRQFNLDVDLYAIDFEGELVALHAIFIWHQARFVGDCVRHLSLLHQAGPIIMIGHSFGGLVIRSALILPDFPAGKVDTLLTIGTPNIAVVHLDRSTDTFYDTLGRFWRLRARHLNYSCSASGAESQEPPTVSIIKQGTNSRARISKVAEEARLNKDSRDKFISARLSNVTLISISGGEHDTVVPPQFSVLNGHLPSHTLFRSTDKMAAVGFPVDHNALCWCYELQRALALVVRDLVRLPAGASAEARVSVVDNVLGNAPDPDSGLLLDILNVSISLLSHHIWVIIPVWVVLCLLSLALQICGSRVGVAANFGGRASLDPSCYARGLLQLIHIRALPRYVAIIASISAAAFFIQVFVVVDTSGSALHLAAQWSLTFLASPFTLVSFVASYKPFICALLLYGVVLEVLVLIDYCVHRVMDFFSATWRRIGSARGHDGAKKPKTRLSGALCLFPGALLYIAVRFQSPFWTSVTQELATGLIFVLSSIVVILFSFVVFPSAESSEYQRHLVLLYLPLIPLSSGDLISSIDLLTRSAPPGAFLFDFIVDLILLSAVLLHLVFARSCNIPNPHCLCDAQCDADSLSSHKIADTKDGWHRIYNWRTGESFYQNATTLELIFPDGGPSAVFEECDLGEDNAGDGPGLKVVEDNSEVFEEMWGRKFSRHQEIVAKIDALSDPSCYAAAGLVFAITFAAVFGLIRAYHSLTALGFTAASIAILHALDDRKPMSKRQ